jgi:hypothetical protein
MLCFSDAALLKPLTASVSVCGLCVVACGKLLGTDFDVAPPRGVSGSTVTSGGGHGGSAGEGSSGSSGELGGSAADATAESGGFGGASSTDRSTSSSDSGSTSAANGSGGETGGSSNSAAGEGGEGGEAGSSGSEHCSAAAPFSAVKQVRGISGPAALAHYSNEELTVYYVVTTESTITIFMATRPVMEDAFRTAEPVPALNIASYVASPTVTADGLTAYLESPLGGQFRIYSASRETQGEPFSVATVVSEIPVFAGGPFISQSGAELYFHWNRTNSLEDDTQLFRATHTALSFQAAEELAGVSSNEYHESHPVLSPDGLALYFTRLPRSAPASDTVVWRAVRSDVSESFTDPQQVTELDTPATEVPDWISVDNCRLYFSRMPADLGFAASSLWVATREPED